MPWFDIFYKYMLPKEQPIKPPESQPRKPQVIIEHNFEQTLAYAVEYGGVESKAALQRAASVCLDLDNIPGFLALLKAHPRDFPQSFVEETIIKHPNLAKLGAEIAGLDPAHTPPQIAKLLDSDMTNGGTTFLSSYDKGLLRQVAGALQGMRGQQQFIIHRGETEYWDAESDTYLASSSGDGNVKIEPTNHSAREAVADPAIPTLQDMMDEVTSGHKRHDAGDRIARPSFATERREPNLPFLEKVWHRPAILEPLFDNLSFFKTPKTSIPLSIFDDIIDLRTDDSPRKPSGPAAS